MKSFHIKSIRTRLSIPSFSSSSSSFSSPSSFFSLTLCICENLWLTWAIDYKLRANRKFYTWYTRVYIRVCTRVFFYSSIHSHFDSKWKLINLSSADEYLTCSTKYMYINRVDNWFSIIIILLKIKMGMEHLFTVDWFEEVKKEQVRTLEGHWGGRRKCFVMNFDKLK